jgi:plasmid stabilization system protein ParE
VARVVYSRNALTNLKRVAQSLRDLDAPDAALAAVARIRSGVDVLQHHPLIGRMIAHELRELVISYGRTGYLALYRYIPGTDVVRVLAIRHQRELDHPE